MIEKKFNSQERYNRFLQEILKKNLFKTGHDLHLEISKNFVVTIANSRKILARAVGQKAIRSSKPYTFGKGQYVYLNNDHNLSKDDIKKVAEISRPPIFRLLELMDQNNGIVSYYEGLKITSAPLENSSTKMSSLDDILTLLMKLEIIYKKKDYNDVVYILYKGKEEGVHPINEELMMHSHYNNMVIDCSVLPDILRWLGKSNILDNKTAIYRNKKTPHIGAHHNNLVWDAFAYTKATGINTIFGAKAETSEKQTLVTLDVVLANEYTPIHFDAFLSRIQINLNSVKEGKRKILPIIIYKSCSDHTFNKIRKNGILAFDIGSIFGKRIYDIIEGIAALSITGIDNNHIESTIENILNIINSAGQKDALKELRGTLFEFLMYPLLTTLYPKASIKRGKILEKITVEGIKENYEYDYIIESNHPSEIIFVELKGYQAGATIPIGDSNTKASLKWFFRRTLPFGEKYYREKYPNESPVKAIFITTAGFYEDGRIFLEQMNKSKYRSSKVNTGYDRETLLELLKENGFDSEIRIIKKFYSKVE